MLHGEELGRAWISIVIIIHNDHPGKNIGKKLVRLAFKRRHIYFDFNIFFVIHPRDIKAK